MLSAAFNLQNSAVIMILMSLFICFNHVHLDGKPIFYKYFHYMRNNQPELAAKKNSSCSTGILKMINFICTLKKMRKLWA